MLRNSLTALGIMSIFGVFFFFVRPDWIKPVSSQPGSQSPLLATKVHARLAADRLLAGHMVKENGGFLQFEHASASEGVAPRIVEDVGDDLPSRNTAYLLIVNKSNNSMRYCRLGASVKKISLRGSTPPEVKLQELTSVPGSPYQAVIWLPAAMDLQLEFELQVPSPARS